jgi:hypothetical protein
MFKRTSILLAALSLFAVDAAAYDVSYPGGNCKAADGNPGQPTVYWDGEIANLSTTQSASVYCPIVADTLLPTLKSAYIKLTDRNNVGNTSCKLNSQTMDSAGNVFFFASADMLSSTTLSSGLLTSQTVPWSGFVQYSNHGLQCTIPPKTSLGTSSLFSYTLSRF